MLFDREKNLYKYKLKKRFKTYFSDGRERPPKCRSGQVLFWPHAEFKTKGEKESRPLFVFIAVTYM
ncbi:hypothetical protein COL53_04340 [Bacillus pseudomycoides]|nr:hypothetical protein COL53_04340 [Bacillus pseudomycoides]